MEQDNINSIKNRKLLLEKEIADLTNMAAKQYKDGVTSKDLLTDVKIEAYYNTLKELHKRKTELIHVGSNIVDI
jgi:hypothetical protein